MKEREIWYEPHPVSAERKAELLASGYRIIDARFKPADNPPDAADNPPDTVDWSKLNVAELNAELAKRGIAVPKGAKRADLLALLEASVIQGGTDA